MTATATKAVRDAIVYAVQADLLLSTILAGDRIYLRKAPPNSPLPYIVLAGAGERDSSRYMQAGHEGNESPRCWGATLWDAEKVWIALYPVLHHVRLPLEGHTMVRGRLDRIIDLEDPDGTATQIVASYRVLSREAA